MKSHFQYRAVRISAVLAAAALTMGVFAGCSAETEPNDGSRAGNEEGLPVDASKEEFIEALSDMEPTTLKVQLVFGPTNSAAKAWEAYSAAVDEWTGGKLKLEILYSGSVVGSSQIGEGIAQGLVDVGQVSIGLHPEEFPVANELTRLAFLDRGVPLVGTLEGFAAYAEVGAASDRVKEEYLSKGLTPLPSPYYFGGGSQMLYCAHGKGAGGSIKGLRIMANSPATASEVSKLGGVLVSLGYDELYEALERGTIDCVIGTGNYPILFGLVEITDTWILGGGAAFTGPPANISIGTRQWEALPVAAQQVLWDQIAVYYTEMASAVLGDQVKAINDASAAGVTFTTLDESSRDTLSASQDAVLKEVEQQFESNGDSSTIKHLLDAFDKWHDVLVNDLGLPEDLTWDTLPDWYETNSPDFAPFVEQVMAEAFTDGRPGS